MINEYAETIGLPELTGGYENQNRAAETVRENCYRVLRNEPKGETTYNWEPDVIDWHKEIVDTNNKAAVMAAEITDAYFWLDLPLTIPPPRRLTRKYGKNLEVAKIIIEELGSRVLE